jgi:hypothetical protein
MSIFYYLILVTLAKQKKQITLYSIANKINDIDSKCVVEQCE